MCSVPLGFTTSNSSLNLALYVKEGSIPFFYELDSVSNVLGTDYVLEWEGCQGRETGEISKSKKASFPGLPRHDT